MVLASVCSYYMTDTMLGCCVMLVTRGLSSLSTNVPPNKSMSKRIFPVARFVRVVVVIQQIVVVVRVVSGKVASKSLFCEKHS